MVSWSEKVAFRRDQSSFYCNFLLQLADIDVALVVFCSLPSRNDNSKNNNNRNEKMTEASASVFLLLATVLCLD